jgi:hypothetical protein
MMPEGVNAEEMGKEVMGIGAEENECRGGGKGCGLGGRNEAED